jgi:hypothetical protein
LCSCFIFFKVNHAIVIRVLFWVHVLIFLLNIKIRVFQERNPIAFLFWLVVHIVVSLAILGKCVSKLYSTYMIRYALTIAGFSC